jgi:hypothetical protein
MLHLNSLSEINAAIELAWESTALAVDDAMLESIVDARYTWPRGESPRDIVDTGALGESQSVVLMGDTIHCEWGNSQVDYAIDVHEGEGSNPARRWTREAIRGDDTAPQQWQNQAAILDVPAHFTDRFRAVYQ